MAKKAKKRVKRREWTKEGVRELKAHSRSKTPVHGEFVNYAAIGIWNRPRQWYRQA